MIIGGSKFTPGTPLQHEMFLIICRQTDRHTDRQMDRHTGRETQLKTLPTLIRGW